MYVKKSILGKSIISDDSKIDILDLMEEQDCCQLTKSPLLGCWLPMAERDSLEP